VNLLHWQNFAAKTKVRKVPTELSNVSVASIARIPIDHSRQCSTIRVELLQLMLRKVLNFCASVNDGLALDRLQRSNNKLDQGTLTCQD
jgi:hypothetical protein